MGKRSRNHIIPQVLLKRFASKNDGEKCWIWRFRRGAGAIEISTKDTAVSKNFYGGEQSGVEEKLGGDEGAYGTIFEELDLGRDPNEISVQLKGMIRNFALRTASFRARLPEYLHHLIQNVGAVPTDEQIEQRALLELDRNPRKFLEAPLRKFLPGSPKLAEWLLGSRVFLWFMKRLLRKLLAPFFRSKHQLAVQTMARDKIPQQLVQNLQLKRLLESAPMLDRFNPAKWRVCRATPGSILMGDSCVIAVNSIGEAGALFRFGTKWDSVYMPLSHSSYLVALSCETSRVLEPEVLNRASAQVAMDEIYSSRWTEVEESLSRLIGTGDFVASSAETDKAIRSAWMKQRHLDDE